MKRIVYLAAVVAAVVIGATTAFIMPSSGDEDAAPIYGIKLPQGYRHWEMISLARVGGPVNDLRVKLGNDIAMRAFRDNTRPFPDGAIIARLAYHAVNSEENNAAFRIAIG